MVFLWFSYTHQLHRPGLRNRQVAIGPRGQAELQHLSFRGRDRR